MQKLKPFRSLMLLSGLLISMSAGAMMVQQFNLGEMTVNADKIFRGTIVTVKRGTVQAGGGELPTIKYTIRVSETLKGDTSSANGKAGNVVELTVLGSIKAAAASGNIRFAGGFTPPRLEVGNEYLLFTTAPSSLGLSITVGSGQGLFRFVEGNKVLNDAKNAGLFRDMDAQGIPQRGPIEYSAIAQRISSLVGQ
jgi:hypothetical protein